jgi:hypothetical protein
MESQQGELSGWDGGEVVLIKIPKTGGCAVGSDLVHPLDLDPGNGAVRGQFIATVRKRTLGPPMSGGPDASSFGGVSTESHRHITQKRDVNSLQVFYKSRSNPLTVRV